MDGYYSFATLLLLIDTLDTWVDDDCPVQIRTTYLATAHAIAEVALKVEFGNRYRRVHEMNNGDLAQSVPDVVMTAMSYLVETLHALDYPWFRQIPSTVDLGDQEDPALETVEGTVRFRTHQGIVITTQNGTRTIDVVFQGHHNHFTRINFYSK